MGTFEITGFSFAAGSGYISCKVGSAAELFDIVAEMVQRDRHAQAVGASKMTLAEFAECGINPTPIAEVKKANGGGPASLVVPAFDSPVAEAQPKRRPGRPPKSLGDGVNSEQPVAIGMSVERFTVPARAPETAHHFEIAPGSYADGPVPTPCLQAPPELVAASTFTHVVKWMIANGFKTQESVQTECARYRDSVPVLQRLAGDVSDRINRALTVLVPNN